LTFTDNQAERKAYDEADRETEEQRDERRLEYISQRRGVDTYHSDVALPPQVAEQELNNTAHEPDVRRRDEPQATEQSSSATNRHGGVRKPSWVNKMVSSMGRKEDSMKK